MVWRPSIMITSAGENVDNTSISEDSQSQHLRRAEPRVDGRSGKIHDWAFRSTDPEGAFAGGVSRWWYWWDDSYQQRYEQLWTEEADRVTDDLADRYWFGWPWLIGEALAAMAPSGYERLEEFSSSVNDGRSQKFHASNPESLAIWGSFQVVRQSRTWREPSVVVCPACGEDFWSGDVTSWAHRKFGPARYCMECCLQSRTGRSQRVWTKSEVIAAIHELYRAFGVIPQQQFAFRPFPYNGTLEQRDRCMRALAAMPHVDTIKDVLLQKDWLGVLRVAGLVGETWRPSRGTWCHAEDGHRCRSLLEKAIDDWLARNSIDHECEPRWPRHPEFNPSGLKRADWLPKERT